MIFNDQSHHYSRIIEGPLEVRSWIFGWRFGPSKAPLLELRSDDGATGTMALELPVPILRTVRIVKYFTLLSAATIFGLAVSLVASVDAADAR